MKLENGQSLFEVVVALGISTIIIIALVSLAAVSIRNATFSKNKTIAARYAQETTEWLRSQRDSDPAAFTTNAQGSWCLPTLSWDTNLHRSCASDEGISLTPFTREAAFTPAIVTVGGSNKSLIKADVSVFWEDSQGIHEVRSSTEFADWRQR